ncbi:uncharacterized protein DUF2523 [Azomonas agilis]|uniref:Uncharacterized protein DUF2523 n=1 Tax=Azomonas agilis TaxID=116849 RepID=A0A562IKF0_9GAMM|nr:DUF2523 family protein [Azomonas agilis]TWH71296.1 uncharacterized protein DUF2523 [Azomonas agilis]
MQIIIDILKLVLDFIDRAVGEIYLMLWLLPLYVFDWIANGIIWFFNQLPVPDFFDKASYAFSNIPEGVVFFAQALQIKEGISMVLSAYLLRFVIRRIPIIG